MGKYEVTQKEYQEIMGTNPSVFKGDNLPVENVSWYDAVEYCNKLSEKEGLTPVYTINEFSTQDDENDKAPKKWTIVGFNSKPNGYRLPTEAEWEYACRAGTITPFNTGNNITTKQANYNGTEPYNNNAQGEYREETTPIGSFASNAWGLYDMHGNVFEWCYDCYADYSSESQTDPIGGSGPDRLLRGGCWYSSAQGIRSAYRIYGNPSLRNYGLGFRLARSN